MRRYSLFGLIFILLVGLLYNSSAQTAKNVDVQPSQEELLLKAMETGGFEMEEFNINTSAFIPNTFLTIGEIEKMQRDIKEVLNIKGEVIIVNIDTMYDSGHQDYFEDLSGIEVGTILEQRVEEEGYNEIIMFVPNEDGNMIVVKLLSTQIVGESETYIIVDIVDNKGYKEIVDISNQIENLLKVYGNEVETTINLTGTQLGKLSKIEEKQRQESIFSFLKARKIEVLEEELFTSITAYSPLISSSINYGGKSVNIQLAMRYSEYENKTYLWIANPLITTTY